MSEHTPGPWKWHWAVDDDLHADCGVYSEPRPGHAYSVCRAPRYQSEEQWKADARLIAAAPETARLLAELVAAAEPISAVAERIPDGINDYTVFLRFPLHDRGLDTEVTAGTLRRLAAAVAATKGE